MIEIIVQAAKLVGVSPALLYGICFAESSLRPHVLGDNGASIGLCQVQIRTAKHMDSRFQKDKEIQDKIDRLKKMCENHPYPGNSNPICFNIPKVEDVYKKYLLDPRINAEVAAKYLKYQLKRYPTKFYNGVVKKQDQLACAIMAYNSGNCNTNNVDYLNRVLKHNKNKGFLNEIH